jgi:hypothetical protein
MIEQIEISIPDEPYKCELPICDPPNAHKKAKAQRSLAYHHEEYAKEIERTNGRNQWIRQVRASVPQPAKKQAA